MLDKLNNRESPIKEEANIQDEEKEKKLLIHWGLNPLRAVVSRIYFNNATEQIDINWASGN